MILITRPLAQSKNLKSLISKLGLEFELFPAFEINKINAKVPIQKYDVIIFISVNAVEFGLDYFDNILIDPIKVFAIGPITAKKLFEKSIKVDGYPEKNASSIELLNITYLKFLKDKKILIVRGCGGSETLKNNLQVNNQVNYLEVYDRVPCQLTQLHSESINNFMRSKDGVVIINSVESLLSVIKLVKKESEAFLDIFKESELIVFSERIKVQATKLGFKRIKVAFNPSDEDIIDILSAKKNKKITKI